MVAVSLWNLPACVMAQPPSDTIDAQHAYIEQEATLVINGTTRRYRHFTPAVTRGTIAPKLLVVGGSGCADLGARMAGLFAAVADRIEIFYLEKSGVQHLSDGEKCSPEYLQHDNFDERVSDTAYFINHEQTLRSQPDDALTVLGLSEGGNVAAAIAGTERRIGRLAIVGSGGMPQVDEFRLLAERHRIPIDPDALEHAIDSIRRSASIDHFFLGHTYKHWQSFLFIDPIELYRKVNVPTVVAVGECDEWMPIESAHVLQKYFASVNHAQSVVIYPGADHSLRAGEIRYGLRFLEDLVIWMHDPSHQFSY